ncbi:MAG: ABC transporter ATP-binding protein [Campylobacterales bacterium]|nr:ABC transporter ATP-binding protein [Campylobacterales bacterium]
MHIKEKVFHGFVETLKTDKRSIYYVLYYTLLEGVLVLSIPLTSSFVINSLIAHSYISLITLGVIISVVFLFIIIVRVLQEYIIEKFEQRVFVTEGYEVAHKAYKLNEEHKTTHDPIDKLMNYFFDITTIQKIFPILVLNGAGLIIQTIMTLLLLLLFDVTLFAAASIVLLLYLFFIIVMGNNGIKYAIERSDTKHNAIHFLQKIPSLNTTREEMLRGIEEKMSAYVDARESQYKVRIRQLITSFFFQGVIISGFFLLGGFLVINGSLPVGEFVASEIIVVTLIYAINGFAKQLDYIYDGIEGFYKIEKLSTSLDTDETHEVHHG